MSGVHILKNVNYNRRTLLIVEIVRLIIGIIFIGYLADKCFGTKIAVLVIIPASLVILILFSKKLKYFYKILEKRFMLNLHGREIAAAEQQQPMSNIKQRLGSRNPDMTNYWDVHLTDLVVSQHATYIGRMLRELDWRERLGINVVYIKRGEQIIYAPGPDCKIMPLDHVGVFASDEVLEKFKPVFEAEQKMQLSNCEIEDIVVEKLCIYEDSPLLHKTIRNSGIREQTGGMVVAIERDSKRILTPAANIVFQELDIVWIVGEKKRLKELK
jgi:CPA2 family monovalent cation:H+ antiporter-2